MSNVLLKSLSNHYINSQGEEIDLDDVLVVKSVVDNNNVEFKTDDVLIFDTLSELFDYASHGYLVVVISNQLTTFELLEVNNELTWCYRF